MGWGWKSSCFKLRHKAEVKTDPDQKVEPKSAELLDSLLAKRTEMESLRKKKEQEEELRKQDEAKKEKEVDDILQAWSWKLQTNHLQLSRSRRTSVYKDKSDKSWFIRTIFSVVCL